MRTRGTGPRCERCLRCALPTSACFCAELVPVRTVTPVTVISHPKELHKPSSSGSFGRLAIVGLELFARGDPEIPGHVQRQQAAGYTPVLLYPGPAAVPLESIPGPIALYAADGNWRQARKVGIRERPFESIAHARLPAMPKRRRLRRHPSPDHLATLEAIAYALRILEGAPGEEVLALYDRFVDAVAELRGWGDGDYAGGGTPKAARPE